MDSSVVHNLASNSLALIRKRAALDSTNISTKRAKFEASCCYQSFSLTDSIIYYITKKPSTAEFYEKAVQTCKYFFIKNPILVIPYLSFHRGSWIVFSGKSLPFNNILSKIWITDSLSASACNWSIPQNLIPSIIPRLYRCDAKKLFFIRQNFSFNDSIFISKSAESIFFYLVTVKYEDDSIVTFEEVLEALPNVRGLTYKPAEKNCKITSKTYKELLFFKLEYLQLSNVPDAFDLDSFYECLKSNKHTQFQIHFDPSFSQAYKNRIEKIIDEIIETKNRNYKPPFISFHGLDFNKRRKLNSICYGQKVEEG